MALGSLSALGIASGTLTYDVIDQLREADESALITPIESSIEETEERTTELSALITSLSGLKITTTDFSDGTAFSKRITDVNGDSVSVEASDGVSVQDMTVDVTQLAANDIYKSAGFASEDSIVNSLGTTQTLTIGIGDTTESFTVEAGASLSDLKSAINELDIGVTASILDTGDDTNPYTLILKSDSTGEDNVITFEYGSLTDLGFNSTSYSTALDTPTYQSTQYTGTTDSVNSSGSTQTLTFSVGDEDYEVSVADGDTVDDLINNINTNLSGDGISATYNTTTNRIEFSIESSSVVTIDDSNLNTSINDETDLTSQVINSTGSDQSIDFTVNGTTHSVTVADGETVQDLIDNINTNLNDEGIYASFNSETNRIEYDIRAIGDISIDTSALDDTLEDTSDYDSNENHLQTAQDAIFKYNGVEITRESNENDDLVAGVALTLEETGKSTISISQDDDAILDIIEEYVSTYNSLVSSLQTLTAYDADTETVGVFQGESAITRIRTDLNSDMFNNLLATTTEDTDANGNTYTKNITLTASDFGLAMLQTGLVDFDSSTFEEMLKSNPEDVENFFTDMFSNLEETIEGLITGDESTLESLNTQYENKIDRLEEELEKTEDRLDTRYEIMAERFGAYDTMINNYLTMQTTLESLIKSTSSSD